MKIAAGRLAKSRRGASAIEFALAGPVLIAFTMAIFQMGVVFFANSGLKHAVGEGARYAMLYPRPSDDDILNRVMERRFGLNAAQVTSKTVTRGTAASGADYAEIQLKYRVPLNFVFFKLEPLTLVETRRAYLQ